MTEQMVIDVAWNAIMLTMKVAAPVLLSTLIIGLVVSIFQAATQINEQNLVFIPKLIGMAVAIVVCGPWILRVLINFTISLFRNIPSMVH